MSGEGEDARFTYEGIDPEGDDATLVLEVMDADGQPGGGGHTAAKQGGEGPPGSALAAAAAPPAAGAPLGVVRVPVRALSAALMDRDGCWMPLQPDQGCPRAQGELKIRLAAVR